MLRFKSIISDYVMVVYFFNLVFFFFMDGNFTSKKCFVHLQVITLAIMISFLDSKASQVSEVPHAEWKSKTYFSSPFLFFLRKDFHKVCCSSFMGFFESGANFKVPFGT